MKSRKGKKSKRLGSGNKENIFIMAKGEKETFFGEWYEDSVASSHMVITREFFEDFKELDISVRLAKRGITAKVLDIRAGLINCLNEDGTQVNITLKEVLYVSSCDNNIISERNITKKWSSSFIFGC